MLTPLLQACGGLGLFLFGLVALTDGLRKLAGEGVGSALRRFTRSPASGALTGAVTTALVQSSSATTVAAIGFVGGGVLTFAQALGIVFGANAGTTVTGWIVAVLGFELDLGSVVLPAVLVGSLLRLTGRGRRAAAGLALAGFATIFIGIDMLRAGLVGFEDVLTPETFPDDDLGGRLLLVLLGLVMTVVTQSSSTGVATAITAVSAGTLRFEQAAAMVIGMDVGTTVTALMAITGASTAARRTGLAHVVYNLMTAVVAFLLLDLYPLALERAGIGIAGNEELSLVGFHTTFNVLGVALVLPFARPFARLMERLVPERDETWTRTLDPALLKEPEIALEAARGALRDMAGGALGLLEEFLREPSPLPERRERLAPLRAAIDRAREFLVEVRPGADRPRAEARHAALIHLLDHLSRLTERSRRGAASERARRDPELRRASARLADLVAEAARDLDRAPTEPLRAHWKELADLQEDYRRGVLDAAARGDLDPELALELMDDMRRLRRTSYHVWRIVRHLREAAGADGEGPEPSDEPRARFDEEEGP